MNQIQNIDEVYMKQSEQYIIFMKQLEIIYFYRSHYHLNFEQIAFIVGSHSKIIECYCLYLLKTDLVKNI